MFPVVFGLPLSLDCVDSLIVRVYLYLSFNPFTSAVFHQTGVMVPYAFRSFVSCLSFSGCPFRHFDEQSLRAKLIREKKVTNNSFFLINLHSSVNVVASPIASSLSGVSCCKCLNCAFRGIFLASAYPFVFLQFGPLSYNPFQSLFLFPYLLTLVGVSSSD